MEEKVIQFDLSADRLLDLAEAKLDRGEYLAAARLLHKSLELYGPGADEYADLAEVYDEMELFELAAMNWFRFLDVCEESERVDAYEGLAACYYNMGNTAQAMFYYKKMRMDKNFSPEREWNWGDMAQPAAGSPFKISWPPEHADYSEEIDEGLQAIKRGEYAKAQKQFLRVHPDSEYRATAMNYLAVTYLLAGASDKAEKVCIELLGRNPDDVQALSTYAAVLTEQDRKAESRTVAERLAAIPTENPDDLYKIATVCCENGLYEQAYSKFCKLETRVSYDRTLLYFKAVAAFRCGKYKESLSSLGKLLDIYPNAAVARYYYQAIRRYVESGGAVPETSFFYCVPQKEREDQVSRLLFMTNLNLHDLKTVAAEGAVFETLEWCFDEREGQEAILQKLALRVAIRADLRSFWSGILLDVTVDDMIKVDAVRSLCERNRDFECGIVIADIYGRIFFRRLEIGSKRRAQFVGAYALCFARFALINIVNGEQLCAVTQRIYNLFSEQNCFSVIRKREALACAIYLQLRPGDLKKMDQLAESMGADAAEVDRIFETIQQCQRDYEMRSGLAALSKEDSLAEAAFTADVPHAETAEEKNHSQEDSDHETD